MDTFIKRSGFLAYGVVCYAAFLGTIGYAIGFVANLWTSLGWRGPFFHSLDFGGSVVPTARALLVDALLLGLFAVQHSVMARRAFKERWTRVIPAPLERSTFVLAASACLALLYWLWRPLGTTVLWDLSGPPFDFVFVALCLAGFAIVVLSTFMIDHFDLFGLRQVWYAFRNRPYPTLEFSAPALYKAVRHPIYLGFIIAFWATPIMTLGHLVFAVATTGYILVAIQLEERDLVHRYGETYRQYRRQVGMLLPLRRRSGGHLSAAATAGGRPRGAAPLPGGGAAP
jgi:protein-S-isoprenylcysteine O-methyltransferase Ste14